MTNSPETPTPAPSPLPWRYMAIKGDNIEMDGVLQDNETHNLMTISHPTARLADVRLIVEAVNSHAALQAELAAVQGHNRALNDEANKLSDELAAVKAERDALRAGRDQQIAETERLRGVVDRLNNSIRTVAIERDKRTAERDALREAAERARNACGNFAEVLQKSPETLPFPVSDEVALAYHALTAALKVTP